MWSTEGEHPQVCLTPALFEHHFSSSSGSAHLHMLEVFLSGFLFVRGIAECTEPSLELNNVGMRWAEGAL